jgi:hypothetical protein
MFSIGDWVHKITGDYEFTGEVRAVVEKLSEEIRYVVEDARGTLHIFNEKQLEERLRQYRAYIEVGGRRYSEVLEEDEEREHFDEAHFPLGKPTWKNWMRAVHINEGHLDKLSGKHVLYGWVEGILQSRHAPYCTSEDGEAIYGLEHI